MVWSRVGGREGKRKDDPGDLACYSFFHSLLNFFLFNFLFCIYIYALYIFLIVFIDHSQVQGFTTQKAGHWTTHNMRYYLEQFALARGLSPLLPQTWYTLSADEIIQAKV